MTTKGEMLLKGHQENICQCRSLRKRIDKLQSESCPEETIAGMALKRTPIAECSPGSGTGSPTEHIAIHYEEDLTRENTERLRKKRELEARLISVQHEIDLFDCVMVGLNEAEAWLVNGYYLDEKSFDRLTAEAAEGGVLYKRGALQQMKCRIIAKANKLLSAITVQGA